MQTVKELAQAAGVSVRTLHYYDQSGLLRPSGASRAGYRLYDDNARERLQQILFFRALGFPLEQIRRLLQAAPADRARLLTDQRQRLIARREQLERQLARLDAVAETDGAPTPQVLGPSEREALCAVSLERLPEAMRRTLETEFGGTEAWKAHYLSRTAQADLQRGYLRLVDWYGGKAQMLQALLHPPESEDAQTFEKAIGTLLAELYAQREAGPCSEAVRACAAEYGRRLKDFLGLADESGAMRAQAACYRDPRLASILDARHGPGAAELFAQTLLSYYGPDPDWP